MISQQDLLALIKEKENEVQNLKDRLNGNKSTSVTAFSANCSNSSKLTQNEILRYSRQLVLPEIGVEGQLKLKNSKVVIVGAGGLGCPVGMYLTAAGVGTIGIVDYDVLDISNLHRQICHPESSIGYDKCASFAISMKNINSSVNIVTHSLLLNFENAEEVLKNYDLIIDASDNVPTRYLLNDAAVMLKKPLVSGSALKFEGQLTIYNYQGGPCYRCLFPIPPSPEFTTNCSDGGVLGAVTGVIGSLQALEVIKIIVGLEASYCKKMLVFDGLTGNIKTFRLRSKKKDCGVCGANPSIKKLLDYEMFCNAKANDKETKLSLLSEAEQISCKDYLQIIESGAEHVLIDVRPATETKICGLPNAVNIPINKINDKQCLSELENLIKSTNSINHYIVCRRGNDSQKAVKILQKELSNYRFQDIKGGLYAWHHEIDNSIPLY